MQNLRFLTATLIAIVLGQGSIVLGSALDAAFRSDEPWLDPGPYQWGYRYWQDTVVLHGQQLTWKLMINYPADVGGEGVPVAAEGAAFPVVFFEHAGGSDYNWYDYLFSRLASHGVIVVSAWHNGSWHGGGSSQEQHRDLFIETMDLIFQWNAEPTSYLYQRADSRRIGVAGHSHGAGAALYLMASVPDLPYDIKMMSLLAPCPSPYSLALGEYLSYYEGLPPLQVIYGSRDQDSCVAYGQSIAIYEPGDRPRHYAYVIGASHHVFDEFGSFGESLITREQAFRAAASAMVPFHVLHLNEDKSALPGLRGDEPLLVDGPEVRYQFHDHERFVIDDFEDSDGEEYGPAIVGIPEQTFINGFLGDTFVNYEAGVSLIQEEIRSLLPSSPPCYSVLFYEDDALGSDVYADAIAREVDSGLLCEPVTTTSQSQFASLINSQDWDLIISANQNGSSSATHPFDAPLRDYVCDGGRIILSDFRINSPTAAQILACSDASFDGTTNWVKMTSTSELFFGTLPMYNPGWGIATYGLDASGDAVVYAVSEYTAGGGHDPLTNSLGLPVVPAGDLVTFDEDYMLDTGRTLYHPTWGLEFAWDSTGQGFTEMLSDHTGDGFDARGWAALSFRILQLHGDPLNPYGQLQDLHVRLTDQAGTLSELALSEAVQGALRYPAPPASGPGWKSVFETYRFTLNDFVRQNPQLDLGALQSIAFASDITTKGRLFIDDIEFSTIDVVLGDITGDGVVDVLDLLQLLAAWGPCSPETDCPEDLTGDDVVDVLDLLMLLTNWS